jgi:hypothetical protein
MRREKDVRNRVDRDKSIIEITAKYVLSPIREELQKW